MASTTLICNGIIETNVQPPVCSTGWQTAQTGLGFDISQLDPAACVSAFSAGATVFFSAYVVAWACAFLVNAIKEG